MNNRFNMGKAVKKEIFIQLVTTVFIITTSQYSMQRIRVEASRR